MHARRLQKKERLLFSCLSRLAPSVTRVAICASRVLLDGLQKKERLLVVYFAHGFLGQYIPPPLQKYRKIPKISPSKYSETCIKRTPSIKRTVAEVPKFISLIYFK